jgi:hypothetical protein
MTAEQEHTYIRWGWGEVRTPRCRYVQAFLRLPVRWHSLAVPTGFVQSSIPWAVKAPG